MLTPYLRQIKERLDAKGYSKRSSGEDALLAELDLLDKSGEVKKLSESHETRMTSPPAGTCYACGRAL
jgi:hypothetical protein